jgi:hypothetical protein
MFSDIFSFLTSVHQNHQKTLKKMHQFNAFSGKTHPKAEATTFPNTRCLSGY